MYSLGGCIQYFKFKYLLNSLLNRIGMFYFYAENNNVIGFHQLRIIKKKNIIIKRVFFEKLI